MKVLSLFDESGLMVRPWVAAGVECTIVDALHPKGIIEGNPRKIGTDLSTWWPDQHYDVVFAFPPCTYLCRPASMWWDRYGGRDEAVAMGMELVNKTIQIVSIIDPLYWLIENPTGQIPKEWRKWDTKFHPAEFGGWLNPPGENYTKETCLWFSPGFPVLERREAPKPWLRHDQWIYQMQKSGAFKGPGKSMASLRSKTPTGFSYAVFNALYPRLLAKVGQRITPSRKVKSLPAVGRSEQPVLLRDLQQAKSMLERDLILDQIREAALYNEISGQEYYEALQVPPPCEKIAGKPLLLPSKASSVSGRSRVGGSVSLGPLGKELMRLRKAMAKAAQAVYDDWDQDDDGMDCELGGGGICDQVSEALWGAIQNGMKKGVPFQLMQAGQDGDDHAWLLAYNDHELYEVDIPPSVYESGRGYQWTKRPDVKITAEDIVIHPLNRKVDGKNFGLDEEVGRKKRSSAPKAKKSNKRSLLSVGSVELPAWENPETPPEQLRELAKTEPRAYLNPNISLRGLMEGTTQYPYFIEANPVLGLIKLETPDRYKQIHDALRRGWIEQGGLKLLSSKGRRLYLADCAEYAIPIYEEGHPGDFRLRKAIEVARDFANNKASGQELYEQINIVSSMNTYDKAPPGSHVLDAVLSCLRPDLRNPTVINGAVKALWATQNRDGFDTVQDWQMNRMKRYFYLEHPELKPTQTVIGANKSKYTKEQIEEALARSGRSAGAASKLLGCDPGTVAYLAKKWGLQTLKRSDPEYRQQQAEKTKAKWTDPEYRRQHTEMVQDLWADPEYRKKIEASLVAPERRERQSEFMKKQWEDPDFRSRQESVVNSPERRSQMSETANKQWSDPDHRKRMSEISKKRWEDPEFSRYVSELARSRWDMMSEEEKSKFRWKRYSPEEVDAMYNELMAKKGKGPSSIGAKKIPAWNDPKALPEKLAKQAIKVPKTYMNPNLPLDVLVRGAANYPLYVEKNPVLGLLELEDPAQYRAIKVALAYAWTEKMVAQLSDASKRLYAADCAEHVLPIFRQFNPQDAILVKAIDAARDYVNHPTPYITKLVEAGADVSHILWKMTGGNFNPSSCDQFACCAAMNCVSPQISVVEAAQKNARQAVREATILPLRTGAVTGTEMHRQGNLAMDEERLWQANRVRFYYAQEHPEYKAPEGIGRVGAKIRYKPKEQVGRRWQK